tara:strand:- start:737 stop:1084 length:348 start_codon:yes stop_codon:yes gene_type:complete
MARKRRNDRNHVIYLLTCSETNRQYIGLTVARGRAYKKSAAIRWRAHVRNATQYELQTVLYDAIRATGAEAWDIEVFEVVRGKQAAHDRERELIAQRLPALNMEGMGRKSTSRHV